MGKRQRPVLLDGVFRGSEARAAGLVTERQLRGGIARRLFQDVYVPAGSTVDHEVRCAGAALIAPADAVITGRSAAALRGIELARPYDPVEMVIPEGARFTSRHGLAVRRTEIAPEDARPWRDVALATPQRLAVDLAARPALADAVADLDAVLRSGIVDIETLRTRLATSRFKGVARARRAAELADPRAESPPESRLRVLLVLDGLRPRPQYEVWCDGEFIARVDLAFVEQKVAVEYNGRWHADPLHTPHDLNRLNRLQAAGWIVIVVTAGPLRENPRGVVLSVRDALDRRR